MKLKDWISNIGPSSIDKCAEKFLNIEIEKEYSSYPNFEEYISIIRKNTKFKTKYTYSFVLLKNGWCVGWNENPSRGWSFPISKWND